MGPRGVFKKGRWRIAQFFNAQSIKFSFFSFRLRMRLLEKFSVVDSKSKSFLAWASWATLFTIFFVSCVRVVVVLLESLYFAVSSGNMVDIAD